MEKIIQIRKEINCDIHTAFQNFTNNDLLESWLSEKADVELKVRGKYELFWDPNIPEENSTIGCIVTGFEEDSYISFDWKGPSQFKLFMNCSDPLTHVIVVFKQLESNTDKTVILLFHNGWKQGSQWDEARNYFEVAWNKALDNLISKNQ